MSPESQRTKGVASVPRSPVTQSTPTSPGGTGCELRGSSTSQKTWSDQMWHPARRPHSAPKSVSSLMPNVSTTRADQSAPRSARFDSESGSAVVITVRTLL